MMSALVNKELIRAKPQRRKEKTNAFSAAVYIKWMVTSRHGLFIDIHLLFLCVLGGFARDKLFKQSSTA
jgi:hypothetical protein